MCDDDVAALVVDNGSGMCKVKEHFNSSLTQHNHPLGWLRWRRRPPRRLPLDRWTPAPSGRDGRYGPEGLVRWR